MSLDKKYNIPAETVSKMVQDGVISCSVVRHYELLDMFNAMKVANPTMSNYEIFYHISEKTGNSQDNVKNIVYKLRR